MKIHVYSQRHCLDGEFMEKQGVSLRNATFCGRINEGGLAKHLLDFGNLKYIPIMLSKMVEKLKRVKVVEQNTSWESLMLLIIY